MSRTQRDNRGSTSNPDPHQIKRSIQSRAKWLYFIFTFMAILILVWLLFTMLGPNAAPLRNLSNDRCYSYRTVEGSRGNIYDRNGEVLSTDSRSYSLYLDLAAEPLTDSLFAHHLPALSDSLGRLFGRPASHYRQLLTETRRKAIDPLDTTKGKRYKLLARHLNQKQYDRLRTFPLMERKYGLVSTTERTRYKMYGSLAAYTISQGIEKAYDSILRSTDGRNKYVRLDSRNRNSVPIVDKDNTPATHGCDIITTIDINLQDVVEGALRDQLARNNDRSGTAVVVECATGEIRAMANLTRRADGEMGDDFNYAIRWHGAPGSTFKGVSLMTLIDEAGVSTGKWIDCGKTKRAVINRMPVNDTHIVGKDECGKTTLKGVFEESSNIGFAKIVDETYREEPERWVDYINGIGLNEVSNIQRIKGLGFRMKHPSSYKQRGGWSHTTLTQTAYGYEINMTPMHTLMFYNAVANGGKLVAPMLVKQIVKEGEVIEEFQPQVVNPQICSPTSLAELRKCMEAVVQAERGTGKALKTLPFEVAGKTGTAQIYQAAGNQGRTAYETKSGGREYLATFVGYFPADNPKYTCIVSIKTERAKGEVKYYTGAGVSLPVFREIAEYIYTHEQGWMPQAERVASKSTDKRSRQGVAPEGRRRSRRSAGASSATQQPQPADKMPDVKGMGLRDAIYTLEQCGLEVTIKGAGTVTNQSIAPGTDIAHGDQVVIELRIEN